MRRVAATRLQHVSTPFPPGRQTDVRTFYGGVLGLTEKRVPDSLAADELVWFEAGDGELELHFFPEAAGDGGGRHFCLVVDDVEAWRRRVEDAGVETRDATAIRNRPRFFCRDPFGNLVELTTIEGNYRT